MRKTQQLFPFLFLAVAVVVFLFLRLYKIKSSFLFFNDPGRDLLILYHWRETGRPPLLGPQTSALPFNQSALYFYFLYPLYLLTGQSIFSAIYTNLLFYLGALLLGVILLKGHPRLLKVLIVAWYLIAIHPEFVRQQRYVWNPSFVAPFIVAAFFTYCLLAKRFVKLSVFLFSFSIATATAFSYSAVPAMLAFLILFAVRAPRRSPLIFLNTGIALMVVNLPTILFELRHHFSLTRLFLNWGRLPQTQNSVLEKSAALFNYSLPAPSPRAGIGLLLIITMAVVYGFYHYREKKATRALNMLLRDAVSVLAITVCITLITPYSLHSHYIFAILPLGMIVLALLPNKVLIPILAVCSVFWLRPNQTKAYFQPAHRSVAESIACARMVCQREKEPMFVSVQAFHPFHNGPEFRYLFRTAGCKIRDIEYEPNAAELMAVVVDNSSFENGKTQYYELSLFGKAEEVRAYECKSTLQVHLLSKELSSK